MANPQNQVTNTGASALTNQRDTTMTRFYDLLNRADSALQAKDYDRARMVHSSMDRFLDSADLTEQQERKFERVMFQLRNNDNF